MTFKTPIKKKVVRHNTGEIFNLESADQYQKFSEEDYKDVADICRSEPVYSVLFKEKFKGKLYTVNDAKKYIKWAQTGWETGEYFVFLVRNSKKEIVAAVDIKSNNLQSAEIGYWSSPGISGIMTNSVVVVCNLAKKASYRELYALTVSENARSQGVLKRAGFEDIGLVEEKGKKYIKFSKKLL